MPVQKFVPLGRTPRPAWVLVAATLLLAGCAYMDDRAADFLDCSRFSAGAGLGLGAEAKATGLLHPSLGITSVARTWGWTGRYAVGVSVTRECYFPLSLNVDRQPAAARPPADNPLLGAMPLVYYWQDETFAVNSFSPLFWSPPPGMRRQRTATYWYVMATLGDFEVGASALLVSARVGFNLAEVVDFLVGFTTLDIAGDDRPRNRLLEQCAPAPQSARK